MVHQLTFKFYYIHQSFKIILIFHFTLYFLFLMLRNGCWVILYFNFNTNLLFRLSFKLATVFPFYFSFSREKKKYIDFRSLIFEKYMAHHYQEIRLQEDLELFSTGKANLANKWFHEIPLLLLRLCYLIKTPKYHNK